MLPAAAKEVSDTLDFARRHADRLRNGKNPYLHGNYAPARETAPTRVACRSGAVPADLPAGVFLRNGPNPKYAVRGLYHWFDGDGMVHALSLGGGGGAMVYTSHQVRTVKLAHEDKVGGADGLNVGDLQGPLGLAKMALFHARSRLGDGDVKRLLTLASGGAANTALVYHAGRLLALVESSHPTELHLASRPASLSTSGVFDFNGQLNHPFTAHPKVCPKTGEMLFFGYSVTGSPNCSYTVVDPEGRLVRTVDIGLKRKIMMHDFAITRNYSVFLDLPLCFSPDNMAKTLSGGAFKFKTRAGARIGVMPRHGSSRDEVVWIDVAPCSVFHTVNAYEEEGSGGATVVVLQACRFPDIDLFDMNVGERQYDSNLYEWRLNVSTGQLESEGPVVAKREVVGDFPQINGKYLGARHRYTWISTFAARENAKFDGVVKVDMWTKEVVGTLRYGARRRGGEIQFVAKENAQSEDDGYLLGFVHDEAEGGESTFWVMDARTMDDVPLAVVELPERVPFGFHALWVPAAKMVAAGEESSARRGGIEVRSAL